MDTGAVWGSYIGLVLLAGAYVAIGVFTSALTENQIVAFVLAAVLAFIFYSGFEALASVPLFSDMDSFGFREQRAVECHWAYASLKDKERLVCR